MPVNPIDVRFFLSGGSSNDDPLLSLGGDVSSVDIRGGIATLFDHIREDDVSQPPFDTYVCIYLVNKSPLVHTNTTIVFQPKNLLSQTSIAYGLLNTVQITTPTRFTAPIGVIFTAGNSSFSVPVFNPDEYVGIWLKRTTPALEYTEAIEDGLFLTIQTTPLV